MLICTLTQQPTLNPVLSLKSKKIFDSNALRAYIETNHTDPITNELIDVNNDVIDISDSITTPNSEAITDAQYSSIPTMLTSFQNAWDSLSLELFQLRSELDKTRKELSLSLYKQDAAVNVAVTACKERDEARNALAQLINDDNNKQDNNISVTNGNNIDKDDVANVVENDDNWDEFVATMKNEQADLLVKHKTENKERKNASLPYISTSEALNLNVLSETQISIKKTGAILNTENNLLGTECIVTYKTRYELLDLSTSKLKVLSTLTIKAGSPVLSFWMLNEPYVISVVPQKKAKNKSVQYQIVNLRTKESTAFNHEIVNISIATAHPSLPIFILSNESEFEVFFNNKSVFVQTWNNKISNIKFHPDGIFIALSYLDNDSVDIYDLTDRIIKLNIEQTSSEPCTDLKFATNGYNLIIKYDTKIGIFDMRKNTFTSSLDVKKSSETLFIDIYSLLIIAGDSYSVYNKKEKSWSEFKTFQNLNSYSIVSLLPSFEFLVYQEGSLSKAGFA